MADAVSVRVLLDGPATAVVHLTNASDGTGESAVLKVDVSALSDVGAGRPCTEVAIRAIRASTIGLGVRLAWNASADDVAALIPRDCSVESCFDVPLVNPKSTGWDGDLNLTTISHSAGYGYDIQLELEKR